jgi:hypothetical protein
MSARHCSQAASSSASRLAAASKASRVAGGNSGARAYARVSANSRNNARTSYLSATISSASNSNTSGCAAGLSVCWKSSGSTSPRPIMNAHSRLAMLRLKARLVPSVAATDKSTRRLCFGTGRTLSAGATTYSSPLAKAGSASGAPPGSLGPVVPF